MIDIPNKELCFLFTIKYLLNNIKKIVFICLDISLLLIEVPNQC